MAYLHLDPAARAVLHEFAQRLAQEEGLDYVGTEHILLALLEHNQGLAAEYLAEQGVTRQRARAVLQTVREKDLEDTWVFGRLPGSPHYRNVIELAIHEATQLEAGQINTAHVLLALLRVPHSTAQRVLARFGITLEGCRAALLEQLPIE